MDKLIIEGGVPLAGEVGISGAKNATLPILCAAILSGEPLRVSNVPHLQDVTTMLGLLAQMGVVVSVDDKLGVKLNAAALNNPVAPYDLVKTMRASVLVLGPLIARGGEARTVGQVIEWLAPHAAGRILSGLGSERTQRLLAQVTPRQAAAI